MLALGSGSLPTMPGTVEGDAAAVYSRGSAVWGGECAVQARSSDSSVRPLWGRFYFITVGVVFFIVDVIRSRNCDLLNRTLGLRRRLIQRVSRI
jgi:hypothetical protein